MILDRTLRKSFLIAKNIKIYHQSILNLSFINVKVYKFISEIIMIFLDLILGTLQFMTVAEFPQSIGEVLDLYLHARMG